MFLLRVSSPGPVDDDEPDRDMPPGPKEPRLSVADTSERRPRVPPEDILLEGNKKLNNAHNSQYSYQSKLRAPRESRVSFELTLITLIHLG